MSQSYHVRHVYPKRSTCPQCAARGWRSCGRTGTIENRRCNACGTTYKVRAIAEEFYDNTKSTSWLHLIQS